MLLTDADITELVKPLGARRKLILKRNTLSSAKPEDIKVSFSTYLRGVKIHLP